MIKDLVVTENNINTGVFGVATVILECHGWKRKASKEVFHIFFPICEQGVTPVVAKISQIVCKLVRRCQHAIV